MHSHLLQNAATPRIIGVTPHCALAFVSSQPCHHSKLTLSSVCACVAAVSRVAVRDPASSNWRVVNTGGRDGGRQKIGSCHGGLVEVPYEALVPRRNDTTNLLVPVCTSMTHVAFATFRLEAQYAIFGHAAGAAAAMSLHTSRQSVHDVNIEHLRELLVSQGQLITAQPSIPPGKFLCSSSLRRCIGSKQGSFSNGTCSGHCPSLADDEWLANDCCGIWKKSGDKLIAQVDTYLKKSLLDSTQLPPKSKLHISKGHSCTVVSNAQEHQYLLCKVDAQDL
jgi:hypothetical protein